MSIPTWKAFRREVVNAGWSRAHDPTLRQRDLDAMRAAGDQNRDSKSEALGGCSD
jgi:hypothetical protein